MGFNMNKNFKLKRILVLALSLAASCLSGFTQNYFIRVNQIGYYQDAPKKAILAGMDASSYEIRDYATKEVVFKGNLEEGKRWNQSNEVLQIADFSIFKKPGKYYIKCSSESSYPFEIAENNVFENLSKSVIKAFYYWRSSTAIEPQYAQFGKENYARAMGHPDTTVYVHHTVATEKRHTESELSIPKGWYDAGDYNLYVVNAGITIHALALAYEMYPEYYKKLNLNIPESGNGVPDLLNEIKWEVDWLFGMQDEDGGVYNKLTTLRFSGMVMPEDDKADRYVVGKSTSAALDYAAIMAMVARIYRDYETQFPGLSDRAIKAAERAWNWAEKNPNVLFHNPQDVHTGSYSDEDLTDEFFWAASELFITTKKMPYFQSLKFIRKFDTPQWPSVASLGLMSMMLHKEELSKFIDTDVIETYFNSLSENVYKLYIYSPSLVPIKKFEWGSNGVISENGAILGLAYYVTKNEKYRDGMLSTLDYLLGLNPTDYCFVSRFGSRYPRNLHDRRTTADGIAEPIPGYLAGGSNPRNTMDCGKKEYPSTTPARCYLDSQCSYSTNEIAINWNAPLVLLVGMVENTFGK